MHIHACPCVYIHVGVDKYNHVCMHARTRVLSRIRVWATHVCACTCICMRTHARVCTRVHTYACVTHKYSCAHVRVRTRTFTKAWTLVCGRAHICMCTRVNPFLWGLTVSQMGNCRDVLSIGGNLCPFDGSPWTAHGSF